jgi:hypothetical protein
MGDVFMLGHNFSSSVSLCVQVFAACANFRISHRGDTEDAGV